MQILIVCTANQCRSPMAEILLRDAVERLELSWQISSSGTHAQPGLAMHHSTKRLLRSYGLQTNGWVTHRLDHETVDRSDLILTAARQHRAAIVSARPDLLDRTFPLLQFAAFAEAARAEGRWHPFDSDAQTMLTAIRAVQGRAPIGPADVDLSDPIGHLYYRFKACGSTIQHAVKQILGV